MPGASKVNGGRRSPSVTFSPKYGSSSDINACAPDSDEGEEEEREVEEEGEAIVEEEEDEEEEEVKEEEEEGHGVEEGEVI